MEKILDEKIKKIKLRTDLYGKAGIVIVVLSSVPDIYFCIWQNLIAVSICICYFLLCIYLNKKLASTIGGTLISLGGNAIAFYSAVTYGELSRAYLFYIPIFIATFLITNYRNKIELVFNVIQITIGLIILDFVDLSFFLDKTIPLQSILWFGKFNTILASSSAIYFLIAFINEISENEDKLEEAKLLLQNQNEELKKKNQELDRLIYSISHDIKAPLSSIEGLVYVTKIENTQPKLEEYFQRMLSSTKRLKVFLENVIDFYKNTKFELMPEEIDLENEINLILQNLKYAPNFNEIEFTVNINQPSTVPLDKLRIQTILVNLLSNAIKYQNDEVDHKKIEINIKTTDNLLKIEVADNGIGIPNEIQDKIFEMFYRGTVKSDGSGLGLYILSETVKKLNGKIKLESIPNVYTKFTVQIPVKS